MRNAVMLTDAVLVGTSLTLHKGQKVRLTKATNIPDRPHKYFARPFRCKWDDGIIRHSSDSILLEDGDYQFI